MILNIHQRKNNLFSLIILAIGIYFLSSIQLNGQERLLRGKILSFNSIPLKGVEVKTTKSKQQTFTDSLGIFEIMVMSKKDRLKCKAKGFRSLSQRIDSENDLELNMVFIGSKKNEKLVTAYGYISKEDLTYAMANLNSENNNFQNFHNIFDLIESFAGVTVTRSSYPPKVTIRGVNSLMLDSTPLFVVDGMTIDIDFVADIHVSTIKQISVIKDSAASIYGSRGANGVILIELK